MIDGGLSLLQQWYMIKKHGEDAQPAKVEAK